MVYKGWQGGCDWSSFSYAHALPLCYCCPLDSNSPSLASYAAGLASDKPGSALDKTWFGHSYMQVEG